MISSAIWNIVHMDMVRSSGRPENILENITQHTAQLITRNWISNRVVFTIPCGLWADVYFSSSFINSYRRCHRYNLIFIVDFINGILLCISKTYYYVLAFMATLYSNGRWEMTMPSACRNDLSVLTAFNINNQRFIFDEFNFRQFIKCNLSFLNDFVEFSWYQGAAIRMINAIRSIDSVVNQYFISKRNFHRIHNQYSNETLSFFWFVSKSNWTEIPAHSMHHSLAAKWRSWSPLKG